MAPKPLLRKAQNGDILTIDLSLIPENDYVPEPLFDTTGIITFVLGWGNYLPGLHALLAGKQAGDVISNVSIDAGWGERNPDLIARIPTQGAEKYNVDVTKVKVGTELHLDKVNMNVVVTEITNEYVVIDANPPLAGASYDCTLKVLNVEATAPEHLEYYDEETETEEAENDGHVGCDRSCCTDIHHHHHHHRERSSKKTTSTSSASPSQTPLNAGGSKYSVASFGLGCFWGGELAYMRTPGVVGTKVGYTQGTVPHPTYDEVCTGLTKHTEAILVIYDTTIVTYHELVQIALHRLDDTSYQITKIGPDMESQYRPAIYYHNVKQRLIAKVALENATEAKSLGVELRKATVFYDAEEYHQQYLLKGGQSAKKGCTEVIRCFG